MTIAELIEIIQKYPDRVACFVDRNERVWEITDVVLNEDENYIRFRHKSGEDHNTPFMAMRNASTPIEVVGSYPYTSVFVEWREDGCYLVFGKDEEE